MSNDQKVAIIIGAGPAGLTAAFELLTRTGVKPIVLEGSDMVGGIARTVNYKGNKIDIGGHRFFSKSSRVMEWWESMLPIEQQAAEEISIKYQGKARTVWAKDTNKTPENCDEIMLVRSRKSRIYYLRKFFDYPVTLNVNTIKNLGLLRMIRIGLSFIRAVLFPIKNEHTLEQFLVNRFGRELYLTFFKSYTEKVWGVSCHEISSAWGAQRIKGLSITKAFLHALTKGFKSQDDVKQKGTETSLIERFLYPKYGPGQMWEVTAKKVEVLGGEVRLNIRVEKIVRSGTRITSVQARDVLTGEVEMFHGDFFFSTMPINHLINGFEPQVPEHIQEVSNGLLYRDFITVGLLLSELKVGDEINGEKKTLTDNWIYIQEPDVRIGRLQIFNNWSPYLVADQSTVWLGLEYFCNENDDLWEMTDQELSALGAKELAAIGIIDESKVLDSTVLRMPKAYPAYFGTYNRFDELREFLDPFENLFLIGRNGMHHYNNQDHSMLTAMTVVDNIIAGRLNKDNIWQVNIEEEYHEESDSSKKGA